MDTDGVKLPERVNYSFGKLYCCLNRENQELGKLSKL